MAGSEISGRVAVRLMLARFTARGRAKGWKRCEKEMRSWRAALGMEIESNIVALTMDPEIMREEMADARASLQVLDRHCAICTLAGARGRCDFAPTPIKRRAPN